MKPSELIIGRFRLLLRLFQGGMGFNISGPKLAGLVSLLGALGILSSAGLTPDKIKYQVRLAKFLSGGKPIGVNIMRALDTSFHASVTAAIEAEADAIICGAGLPLDLPSIKGTEKTALIVIVSSGRALDIIIKTWWKRYGRLPDAVIVEGPKAGGHLGFKISEIDDPAFSLEKILLQVLAIAKPLGIPVVAAGGIYSRDDSLKFLSLGASAVQLGTRFLASFESGASDDFKNAVVKATAEDIIVVGPGSPPGSPAGMPFRVIAFSPGLISPAFNCKCHGYLLWNGKCKALPNHAEKGSHFCICNSLADAVELELPFWKYDANGIYVPNIKFPLVRKPIWTTGANGALVSRICSAADIVEETGVVIYH